MQPRAIQAALDNLVEAIRTGIMAEFLERLRGPQPTRRKTARKSKSVGSRGKKSKAKRKRQR
jgi:hypothetical protein